MQVHPLNRPLAAFVLLMSCVSVGCTYYSPTEEAFNAAVDAAYPDGRWKSVPLAELLGSEDQFKGKEMMFHTVDGDRNMVIVERVDSTFVYAWDQWDKNSRKFLIKIKLQTVTKAERYEGALRQYKWHHWALIPVVIAVALLLGLAAYSGGW